MGVNLIETLSENMQFFFDGVPKLNYNVCEASVCNTSTRERLVFTVDFIFVKSKRIFVCLTNIHLSFKVLTGKKRTQEEMA